MTMYYRNPEFYPHRKEERCARQFGTTNPDHPCIKVTHQAGIITKKPSSVKNLIHTDDHGIWSLVGWRWLGGVGKDHLAGWSWSVQAYPSSGFILEWLLNTIQPIETSCENGSRSWKQMQSLLFNCATQSIMGMLSLCLIAGEFFSMLKNF